MPSYHPNLSPAINERFASMFMFRDLVRGDRLHVTATDARTRKSATLELLVVDLGVSDEGLITPTFVLVGGDCALFASDGKTPVDRPAIGTVMGPGLDAVQVPETILSMVGLASMSVGRDYSFVYVGGENVDLILHHISLIDHRRPDGQVVDEIVAPYAAALQAYRSSREDSERRQAEEKAARDVRLRRAMVVTTVSGSVYRIGAAGDGEKRSLCNERDGASYEGTLIALRRGRSMIFRVAGDELETSSVVSIDPDPDEGR